MAEQAVENNIGLGLFGDDDEEDVDHQQLQQQQYQDDLDADDILGLDDDAEVIENPEGSLLMRFCPHDSSMLYPKVSFISAYMLPWRDWGRSNSDLIICECLIIFMTIHHYVPSGKSC